LGFKRLKCMDGSVEVTLGAPPEITKPAAVVVDVTAKQLLADYQENEIAADAKYKGQALRVKGKVTRISKDIFDAPLVDLATSNQFMPVYATFASEGARALAELKRGQQVTVRCRSKGVSMAHPLLEDCVLDPTKADIAQAAAMNIAHETYDAWALDHPTRKCPKDIAELMMRNDATNDPWGQSYRMFCNPSAPPGKRLRVASSGPDQKPDTDDDIKSWE
jgi:hypothetical protein